MLIFIGLNLLGLFCLVLLLLTISIALGQDSKTLGIVIGVGATTILIALAWLVGWVFCTGFNIKLFGCMVC